MDGRLIRKRFGRKVTVLAASISIGILLMGGILLYLSSGVRDAWNNYSVISESRSSALSELHRAIGYGGFIHNFKNYVLRKESPLLDQLNKDLHSAFAVIDTYHTLNLNSQEKTALAIIKTTFLRYEEKIDIAKQAIGQGALADGVDARIRVDDRPALTALGIMQAENHRYNQAVSGEMNEQLGFLINVLLAGLLAMPFVIWAAYHYHDVMSRFIALTIEKKEVERVLEDATALAAEAEEKHIELAYEAYHCELTRVANRKAFMKTGQTILDEAKRLEKCLSVLFVDVDDFKFINDTYGHELGDKVLVDVASRLTVALREGDFVARIGGDEFAMIIQCPEAITNYERLIERLLEAMNKSYEHLAEGLSVSCSVGGAFYPKEGQDLESLIRIADARMYSVKKSGKNGVYLAST
jgi:diguanylate cyclase (GGDEF)-like protein